MRKKVLPMVHMMYHPGELGRWLGSPLIAEKWQNIDVQWKFVLFPPITAMLTLRTREISHMTNVTKQDDTG